jgi:hypothetical protein
MKSEIVLSLFDFVLFFVGIPKGAMLTHRGSVSTSAASLYQVVSFFIFSSSKSFSKGTSGTVYVDGTCR